jgi:phosphoglycolate phosphatase
MKYIIWDWNGTLLSDVELCVSSMNVLLKERNLPQLSAEIYRDVFSFPVKDYYQTIGFDFGKEDFSVPAHQYIDLYNKDFDTCSLQESAIEVLSFFEQKGVRQFVLSAMEHQMLVNTLEKKEIAGFFEGIAGLEDHYAVSKIDQGRKLIEKFGIARNEACLVGDTVHDFEVSEALGIKCILIADGHQSEERLLKTGVPVLKAMRQLIEFNMIVLHQ